MSEGITLALGTLERLLQRGGDAGSLAAGLDETGLLDALLLEVEPFTTAGVLAQGLARYDLALPAGDTMAARWLLGTAGLASPAPFPVPAWPATQSGACLRRVGGNILVEGRFVGVPWTGAPLVSVLMLEGIARVVILPDHTVPQRMWRNLADEPRAEIALEAAPPVAWGDLPAALASDTAFLVASYLRAAQLLGAMDQCAILAGRYAKQRRQFGRPIAQFQAVQHLIAQMAVTIAMVKAAVRKAGAALDRGAGAFEVAAAKALASAAAGEVAAHAHQVHGAIGFTLEYPLGTLTRRLWAWRDEYGDERFWNTAVGKAALGWRGELWQRLVDADGRADSEIRRILATADMAP